MKKSTLIPSLILQALLFLFVISCSTPSKQSSTDICKNEFKGDRSLGSAGLAGGGVNCSGPFGVEEGYEAARTVREILARDGPDELGDREVLELVTALRDEGGAETSAAEFTSCRI